MGDREGQQAHIGAGGGHRRGPRGFRGEHPHRDGLLSDGPLQPAEAGARLRLGHNQRALLPPKEHRDPRGRHHRARVRKDLRWADDLGDGPHPRRRGERPREQRARPGRGQDAHPGPSGQRHRRDDGHNHKGGQGCRGPRRRHCDLGQPERRGALPAARGRPACRAWEEAKHKGVWPRGGWREAGRTLRRGGGGFAAADERPLHLRSGRCARRPAAREHGGGAGFPGCRQHVRGADVLQGLRAAQERRPRRRADGRQPQRAHEQPLLLSHWSLDEPGGRLLWDDAVAGGGGRVRARGRGARQLQGLHPRAGVCSQGNAQADFQQGGWCCSGRPHPRPGCLRAHPLWHGARAPAQNNL
mmetsp:Transcript_247/g.492  ORF Transcript_247/g.492 Transcript_247/m.492 type:complete len:357 (+) Transcript_247:846-1916(+)